MLFFHLARDGKTLGNEEETGNEASLSVGLLLAVVGEGCTQLLIILCRSFSAPFFGNKAIISEGHTTGSISKAW